MTDLARVELGRMHPDPIALVALAPSLTAVLDTDGVPVYLSPRAAALFETIHPDDAKGFELAFRDALVHPDRVVAVRLRAGAAGRIRHLAGQFLNRVGDPRIGGVVLHLADVSNEAAIAAISRDLLDRGGRDLDACIVDALATIARLCEADRAAVFRVCENGMAADLTHEWTRSGDHARVGHLRAVPLDAVARVVDVLLEHGSAAIDLVHRPDLAPDAAAAGASRTRSCVLAPLAAGGRIVGCVTLEIIDHRGAWQPTTVSLLDVLAPLLAAAIERGRIERGFHGAQVRFEEAWKHAPIGMVMLSGEGRLLRVNPAYCELLGYAERELVGAPLAELLHPEDLDDFGANVERLLAGEHDRFQLEARFSQRAPVGGELWTWCRASLSLVRDDEGEYLIGQVEDITDRRAFEARLAYAATHDALSGLPRRNPLLIGLERALAGAERRGDMVAVLFIDLDNFKRVNDTLGHAAGDELLQSFARRLERAVRPSDMAARLGGDEFAVMCTGLTQLSGAVSLAQRILSLVEQPFRIQGTDVLVGASVGVAMAERGIDAATLLRQADTAAYLAKERGRNRYEIFDDESPSDSTT